MFDVNDFDETLPGPWEWDLKRLAVSLLLDTRDGLRRGGDSGPAIRPGHADESLLIEAVRYESYEMPPRGMLPEEDIQNLEKWVAQGAPWPDEPAPVAGEGPCWDGEI